MVKMGDDLMDKIMFWYEPGYICNGNLTFAFALLLACLFSLNQKELMQSVKYRWAPLSKQAPL